MSAVKYDSYTNFAAGSGFIEALVDWMRQFDQGDRETAYRLVKERLVFISSAEMQRLIEGFLPEFVTPYLRSSVASGQTSSSVAHPLPAVSVACSVSGASWLSSHRLSLTP